MNIIITWESTPSAGLFAAPMWARLEFDFSAPSNFRDYKINAQREDENPTLNLSVISTYADNMYRKCCVFNECLIQWYALTR